MQVFHSNHQGFNGLLACFEQRPKIVPAFSIIVADDKKPIALFCIYHDAGVAFLHGLFKSKFATVPELHEAIKFAEIYIREGLSSKFGIVVYTDKKWLKKILEKNDFKCENISMFSRVNQ